PTAYCLKYPLRRRQLHISPFPPHGHLDRFSECLEYSLDLVVFVAAFGLDIQVTPGCIRKRLEEMEEHFCGHFADLFAREGRVPYQPGSPAKIDSHLGEAVVHGETEAIAFDSSFITQCLRKGFTQR